MSNNIKVSKRTEKAILSALRKGKTLREIGEKYGLSHQKVWRIGDKNFTYSARSGYLSY